MKTHTKESIRIYLNRRRLLIINFVSIHPIDEAEVIMFSDCMSVCACVGGIFRPACHRLSFVGRWRQAESYAVHNIIVGFKLGPGGHRPPNRGQAPEFSRLQHRVYHGRKIDTVEELKRAIITEWQKLSQRFIDSSINEWRRRLECVVRNDGRRIKHCSLA